MNEIALGIYLALQPRVDRDGWWRQRGFAIHQDVYSISASISYRIGTKAIVVSDLGRSSQFVAFTRSDDNYNKDTENNCNGECLPTTWGYNYQHAQLLAVTDEAGVLRYGGGLKRTRWTHIRHESEDGDHAKRFTWNMSQTEYSLAPVVGLVGKVGDWKAVAQWTGDGYRIRERGYVCCPRSKDTWQFGVEK